MLCIIRKAPIAVCHVLGRYVDACMCPMSRDLLCIFSFFPHFSRFIVTKQAKYFSCYRAEYAPAYEIYEQLTGFNIRACLMETTFSVCYCCRVDISCILCLRTSMCSSLINNIPRVYGHVIGRCLDDSVRLMCR